MQKEEVDDVKNILEWERFILADYDKKYDPDDDSEDEEKIARKRALKLEAAELKLQEEAARQAALSNIKGKR